jgi:hypothetical protein
MALIMPRFSNRDTVRTETDRRAAVSLGEMSFFMRRQCRLLSVSGKMLNRVVGVTFSRFRRLTTLSPLGQPQISFA